MIDRLQRIARRIALLRLPSLVLGIVCVTGLIAIAVFAQPQEWDRWLMPCLIGLLWSVSAYSFITTFRTVPAKADESLPYFARMKRRLVRGGYWLVGLAFIGTTLAVLLATYKMLSLWLRQYGA